VQRGFKSFQAPAAAVQPDSDQEHCAELNFSLTDMVQTKKKVDLSLGLAV
jgi:hypothetical protein